MLCFTTLLISLRPFLLYTQSKETHLAVSLSFPKEMPIGSLTFYLVFKPVAMLLLLSLFSVNWILSIMYIFQSVLTWHGKQSFENEKKYIYIFYLTEWNFLSLIISEYFVERMYNYDIYVLLCIKKASSTNPSHTPHNSISLPPDAARLWDRWFKHALLLKESRVLSTKRLVQLFTPLLVERHATYSHQVASEAHTLHTETGGHTLAFTPSPKSRQTLTHTDSFMREMAHFFSCPKDIVFLFLCMVFEESCSWY